MTTLTRNTTALSKKAQRIKIGNYFTRLEENEIGIYQVRRDNVKMPPRAYYVGSIDNKVEAEELVKQLNTRQISFVELHKYFERREDEKVESNSIENGLWGYPSN